MFSGSSRQRRSVPHRSVTARKARLGMTNARGTRVRATAALLLVAVTACAADGSDPPRDAESSTTSPSTTATSEPTPSTASEAASEAAVSMVRTYYVVRDELRQSPMTRLAKLTTVATSGELAAQQTLFKRERRDGLHQTGDTRIAEIIVRSVNLDNSDPEAGRVPTVQIDVCYDVMGVDILDGSDTSVVSDDRPDTGWIRYLVSNYNFEADPSGSWRVASSQNLERTPCDAV